MAATASARNPATVSALNNIPGVSKEPSSWVGDVPNVNDANARCSLTNALPDAAGSQSTS